MDSPHLLSLIETMAEALQIASLELQDIAAGLQPPTGAVAAKYIENALAAYAALSQSHSQTERGEA